jgi:hypothetical protein
MLVCWHVMYRHYQYYYIHAYLYSIYTGTKVIISCFLFFSCHYYVL